MQPLNYCRSLAKERKAFLDAPRASTNPNITNAQTDLAFLEKAIKFALPVDGKLIDDEDAKALTDDVELTLPFPYVALEFSTSLPTSEELERRIARTDFSAFDGKPNRVTDIEMKVVLLVTSNEDRIIIRTNFFGLVLGRWGRLPEIGIPRTQSIKRNEKTTKIDTVSVWRTDETIPTNSYSISIKTVVGFLNALQCSNVHIKKLPRKHEGKKVKSALPFDTYHVLEIGNVTAEGKPGVGGEHRSPREHLRRGHIRRLANGLKVWVNAAVICAGRNTGRVFKDYEMV